MRSGRLRRGTVDVAQGEEAAIAMAIRPAQGTAEGCARDVVTWYHHATDGETVVIACAVPPAIRLVRRPHQYVYWWTEGGRGLTVTLEDARQRLAMVSARASFT